jgi:4-amino-4-deoxy-L-arabinose transferase-like glycosyltransferase
VAGFALIVAAYPLLAGVSALIIDGNHLVTGVGAVKALPAQSWTLSAVIGIVLLVMGLFQWHVISGRKPAFMRSVYVHALSGFYIGIIANRFTAWVWSMADGFLKSAQPSSQGNATQISPLY